MATTPDMVNEIQIDCDIKDLAALLRGLKALSPESPIKAKNAVLDCNRVYSVTIKIPSVYAGFMHFPSNP